jgi:chemotaxis response regulator CheB
MSESPSPLGFAIVGVGASAGGIEAFERLLRYVPETARLAFVFVQHRGLEQTSELVATLEAATNMPIHYAKHGMRVEPGRVYVTEPGVDVAIRAGELACSQPTSNGAREAMPVDFFLRSLAAERGKRAIGVVLSGSARDGTEGLRAIRAEGGIALAQAPCSARFADMPQSAIDAAAVDYCLDLPELGAELVRLSVQPYVHAQDSVGRDPNADLVGRMREQSGSGFRQLKSDPLTHRLAQRLASRGLTDLHTYLALLDSEPSDVVAAALDADDPARPVPGERLARLEQDLAATREYLHILIEAHARAAGELKHSATPAYGGLGLGLSLVRRLVELHGGSMRVVSTASDRGPTFTVTFPFGSPDDAPDPARFSHLLERPGRTKSYAALSGVRVLVIDDDPHTREAVLEVLHYTGANVTVAASAAEGLSAYTAFEPQVIVCEIAMQTEDGYAFIRKLRLHEGAAHRRPIPAMALTSLVSAADKQRVLAAGYQRHLAKPIDIDRLRDAVLELTERGRGVS